MISHASPLVSEESHLTFGRIPKSGIKSLRFDYELNISIITQINQITLLEIKELKRVSCSYAIDCQSSFVSSVANLATFLLELATF